MPYVIYRIRQAILLTLPGVAAFLLADRVGIGMTVLALAIAAAVAVTIAGVLFQSSEVGKVTWKNRVAGPLAPWGWRFANGKLIRALIGSWVVWVLLAVPGILVTLRPATANDAGSPTHVTSAVSTIITVLLAIAWVIDGGALLWVMATLTRNFSVQSSSGKSLIKLIAFGLVVIASSVIAFLTGHSLLAIAIAGAPPLAVGLFFAVYIGAILAFGKNVRWN